MTKPRFQEPGNFFHVTSRGVEKRIIFHDDMDYRIFLKLLTQSTIKFNIKIYAYCLMSNHFHLLIGLQEKTLSKFMQHVLFKYAKFFNSKYERGGHLFERRYFSSLVEDEDYLIQLTKYIHLNPCRANIVETPLSFYEWSSLKFYLDTSKTTSLLDKNIIKKYFPHKGDYKEFVSKK